MNTSKYRYRITIQEPVVVRQSNGSMKNDFQDFLVDIYASKRDISGNKEMSDKEVKNIYTKAFTIAYRSTIKSNMQVIFKEVRYKINFISELGFNDELELFCENI
jgi:SPP1 family predicted phage head-tail adaptor